MARAPRVVVLVALAGVACGPSEPFEHDYELAPGQPLRDFPAAGLTWDTPIDDDSLAAAPSPLIAGATLRDIVSSRHIARPDGRLCSECHYRNGPVGYRPEVAEESDQEIDCHEVHDGRSWAGEDGWAARFIALGPGAHLEKPEYLRDAFAKWRADGAE